MRSNASEEGPSTQLHSLIPSLIAASIFNSTSKSKIVTSVLQPVHEKISQKNVAN